MSKKKWLVIIVIVAAAIVLAILFDMLLANHRPAITSLKAEPERVIPSGSCQILCNATDRDGDELSYNWSAEGGVINGEGATVNWTAPNFVGSYNVTVTVTDSHGGKVTSQINIIVRTNLPPTITSLTADAIWTLPSGSVNVTCDASDLDGDEMSYEWTTTGGSISGTGAAVNWIASEQVGVYNITAVVKDAHGYSDTSKLPISVATGQPPTIKQLLITKDRYGHCYLLPYSWGYKVGKGQMYDIECIVSDTSSEVSYNWSWDGGEIYETSEDGSMIAWKAPDVSDEVTITVIVSDIAGNMISKNLVLNVVTCSTCTFGHCPG